jgi:hypothetical protein
MAPISLHDRKKSPQVCDASEDELLKQLEIVQKRNAKKALEKQKDKEKMDVKERERQAEMIAFCESGSDAERFVKFLQVGMGQHCGITKLSIDKGFLLPNVLQGLRQEQQRQHIIEMIRLFKLDKIFKTK